MKILLIHNFYKIAGGEDTVFRNEEMLLKRNGHEVFTYTRSNKEIEEFGLIQRVLLPFTAIFSFKTYYEIRNLIQKEKIELVHVHNTLTLISPSVFYATLSCKIPVVQTLHNFRMECPNALFYRDGRICEECMEKGLLCSVKYGCYRNSRLQSLLSAMILKIHRMTGIYRKVNFICLSEFNKYKLLQLNRGNRKVVNPLKVFVKPNFIFEQQLPASILPTEKRKNQYLYAGRLEEVKGIRQVLEHWKKEPERKLIVCGTGSLESWCHQYVKENGIENVEFLGQVSRETIMGLLRESKAFLFPSVCYEGQPMGIIESYSVGTPVIGNPVSEPVGNVKELLNSGIFSKEQGLIEKSFLPEENYRILMEIYQEALGRTTV